MRTLILIFVVLSTSLYSQQSTFFLNAQVNWQWKLFTLKIEPIQENYAGLFNVWQQTATDTRWLTYNHNGIKIFEKSVPINQTELSIESILFDSDTGLLISGENVDGTGQIIGFTKYIGSNLVTKWGVSDSLYFSNLVSNDMKVGFGILNINSSIVNYNIGLYLAQINFQNGKPIKSIYVNNLFNQSASP